jgi:hypothetical protein
LIEPQLRALRSNCAYEQSLFRDKEDGKKFSAGDETKQLIIFFSLDITICMQMNNKASKIQMDVINSTHIKTLGMGKNKSSTSLPSDMDFLIGDELAPEPVLLPDKDHLLNWHTFRFRKEEVDKDGHDNDPSTKEEEETKLHYT